MTIMKTIIITILVFFLSFFSYGQVKDTTLIMSKEKIIVDYDSGLNDAELREYFNDIRENKRNASAKASNAVKNLIPQIPITADGCENGDFENPDPYSSWTGLGLKHQNQTLPIENGLITDTGVMPFTLLNNLGVSGKYIQFQTPGTDPNLAGATPSTSLQKVVSGNQSIRLGNNNAAFASEGIAKRFVVTPQNAKYYFQYAVVMDKSHSNPDGSPNGSEVFFIAEALDASGNTIDKIVDIGNPSNPFISAVTSNWATNNGTNNTYYRNWRCAYLDLSSHIGQEVTILFINSDCSAGAHQGYTYLDAVCEPCVNVNEGDIDIDLEDESCMDFPQTIEGSFVLPASGNATNESITLEIYQNNVLVNTLTNPTLSGGNYSFSLSPSDFPYQDDGQCYDLVSILSFQMPDMSGTLQTVNQYSSEPNNGVQDGETPGLDNDVCFCSDDDEACCSIEDFDASIQENNGTFDVMINGGSIPLQEVEISMVDYHIDYEEEDCKPDDLGVFGTLTTTTTSLENLVLNPGDNGTSSLTWMLGNPSVINSSVNLDILNPEVLNLECCDVEFYFCLKVKVSNVDCDDCETIICYSSEDSQDTDDPKPCEINIDPLEDSYCVGDEINLNWNTNTTGNLSIVITDGNNIWNTVDNNVSSSQNSYQYTIPSSIDCDKDWYFNISFNDYDGECWSSSTKFRVDCCDDQNLDCECGKWLDDSVFIKGYQKRIPRDPNQKINLKSNFEDKVKCGKKIKLNPSLNYTFKAPNYLCNPQDCEVEYKWNIIGENGSILSGTGQIINYTFNNPGDYSITYTPICDGKKCKPCRIGISIPETD